MGKKLGIRKNLKSLKKFGNSIVICKLEIDNRKLEIRYFDKIWKFRKKIEIWKKIGNLEKKLEIWKNLEIIWKFGNISKFRKKMSTFGKKWRYFRIF